MGGYCMNKDIYDHLNDVEIDIEQYSEATVTDFEKQQVLMNVKQKAKHNQPARWKKTVMAAAMSVGLSSAALFGLSFTTFAHEIPILSNIFQLFGGEKLYADYENSAEIIGETRESSGVAITMNEVVFDGQTLYMNYILKSEHDLGESPYLEGMPVLLESNSRFYAASTDNLKKVGKNEYVGMMTGHLIIDGTDEIEEGAVQLSFEAIVPDEAISTEKITGNWDFHFNVSTTANKVQLVQQNSEGRGVNVDIEKIIYTPMSFLLFYNEYVEKDLQKNWDFILTDVVVKDNLGNVYESQHNGGYSASFPHLYHNFMFQKIDPKATKLIVTPIVELSDADKFYEYGGKSRSINSTAPIEEFELEDIIIEIEK